MFRVAAWSTAIALVPFVLGFALCWFLSFHPTAAQVTWLSERVAHVAYSARLVPIQYRPDCARYDARVTYLLRTGRCRFSEVEFDTQVGVNSFGLRDDERSLTKPDIIVLGDSFAMGHGVEDREAFPQVLERSLGLKVLNAGVSSFATARELMLLRLLDTTAARVIVIQHHPNDLEENQSLLQHGTLPILPEHEYRTLVEQAQAGYRDWLLPGLTVLRQAGRKLVRLAGADGSGDRDILEADAFHNALASAADILRGRQIVILELGTRTNAQFIDAARSRTADLGLDLTFVDVSAVLKPADYFVLDGHMRASGHEKVAMLLARTITGRLQAAAGDGSPARLKHSRQ